MVKAKRELVFATFVTSGLAVIASFVALGTPYWVRAEIIISSNNRNSDVHYGLFTGVYTRQLGSETAMTYDVLMTCLVGDNICAMLCDSTSEKRSNKLTALYNKDENVNFGCSSRSRFYVPDPYYPKRAAAASNERVFINAGLYISTIVFLVLSCMAGLGASVLAMWNTVYNPIETFLNVMGVFVCNCVAVFFVLMTMVMWGALFGGTLVDNICVYDTIVEDNVTSGNAILHFSYWLNLVALVLYVVSIVILGVRQHLINTEPMPNRDIDETNDPDLLIY